MLINVIAVAKCFQKKNTLSIRNKGVFYGCQWSMSSSAAFAVVTSVYVYVHTYI